MKIARASVDIGRRDKDIRALGGTGAVVDQLRSSVLATNRIDQGDRRGPAINLDAGCTITVDRIVVYFAPRRATAQPDAANIAPHEVVGHQGARMPAAA